MLHRIRMQAFLRPVMAGYHHHHQQQQQQQQQLLLQQQQQQQQEQMHLQLQQEQQHLQEQQAFDQEMASHSEYDQQQQPSYDWSQDSSTTGLSLDMLLSLGSGPIPSSSQPSSSSSASASSLSNGSVTGPILASIPDATMSEFYSSLQQQQLQQQQHYHSLSLSSIPLVSYSEDYSSPSAANLASSLVLSTQQPSSSLPNASSQLPQQTYYELLMAANPNEPLSQLLSTSAATMTSTCFTATATSSIPATVASSSSTALPLDQSSTYTSIDSIPTDSASPSLSTATVGSMVDVEAPTAEQILTSVASAYSSLSAFPLGPSMDAHQQQQQQQQPQTVPLTTKEIMDALSGQFPIQPVMTSTVTDVAPPSVASDILNATTAEATASTITAPSNDNDSLETTDDSTLVATVSSLDNKDSTNMSQSETAVLTHTPITTATESGTVPEWTSVATATTTVLLSREPSVLIPVVNVGLRHEQQQQQDESWESDVDVLSPPSLVYVHDTDDEGSSSTAPLSCVTSPPAQVDLEMSEMTLTSPPLSPSKGPRMLKRSKSLVAGGLTSQSADNGQSASQRRKSRRISRRHQAVSESSSFGSRLEALESELDEQYELDSQQHEQQSQQVAAMPPKRRRPSDDDVSESPCSSPESSPPSPRTPPPSSALPPITATHDNDLTHHHHHGSVVVAHSVDHELDPSKRFKVEEVHTGVEGEDAGVLSPLLLCRSPKRQSSRLLRRTSGRS
ncbi:hypothetical protein BGZ96_004843 [Linnemannia gamsii]|uniref:Uncharacterized protein n=1 Tax=Linnemannia gamsii TaxID=64522 RepID=A0ABQ7K5S6_9FUNG|nr:hypothetical protein BGZ96_004843 [Linnemannia gamsii]